MSQSAIEEPFYHGGTETQRRFRLFKFSRNKTPNKKLKLAQIEIESGKFERASGPPRLRGVSAFDLPATDVQRQLTPVVLHHGIFNGMRFKIGKLRISSFGGSIEKAIVKRGHPLILTKVHPTAGVARRAAELKDTILRKLNALGRPDEQVIIIAHSMGGLDARYMISCLGMADRVKALVTISTPHRGSSFADWCHKNLGQRLRAIKLARMLRIDIGAMQDLTLEGCRTFNESVPDSPQVRYFSISGAKPRLGVPPFAWHSWRVINDIEGANDGQVSVQSSIWGKHLGVWPVDHWHEVNKRFVFERHGVGNIAPYYLRILDELEDAGVET